MTNQAALEQRIAMLRAGGSYRAYLAARAAVFAMLDHQPDEARPSAYWTEEIAGFEYLFDASPLIIEKLRQHTYHITGLHDYEYRSHHNRSAEKFARRLADVRAVDANGVFVPESRALGGFGFSVDGKLINFDTLKFYEGLVVLDREGYLAPFRDGGARRTVVEIGSGWGGFAYQFKTLFPRTTYVLVDLPASLLFAATYLISLFPHARIKFVDGAPGSAVISDASSYDFIFVPHYAWRDLVVGTPDMAVNFASFQEMTTGQVDGYIAGLHRINCPVLYSMNRDHSPNNDELTTVRSIIKNYYRVAYDALAGAGHFPSENSRGGWKRRVKKLVSSRLRSADGGGARDYRHVIAKLSSRA
ncbi:MAG: putative sugar O-methyltransferase [bacterium]|nr:putative sugar O-methyltransferase [bacterium]